MSSIVPDFPLEVGETLKVTREESGWLLRLYGKDGAVDRGVTTTELEAAKFDLPAKMIAAMREELTSGADVLP